MKHFPLVDWVDYSRGVVGAPARAAMEQHVRDGCNHCASMLASIQALAADLHADEAFEPPAHVLRLARAVFRRPEVVTLPRVLARLLHDTVLGPLPVGVRGRGGRTRQVLYRAGATFVDLRLERRPGRPEVVLAGQVLGQQAAGGASQPWVVLTSGGDVVETKPCNDYGEFLLEYIPAGQMRLHIPVEDGTRRIEIALNRLTPRGTARQ